MDEQRDLMAVPGAANYQSMPDIHRNIGLDEPPPYSVENSQNDLLTNSHQQSHPNPAILSPIGSLPPTQNTRKNVQGEEKNISDTYMLALVFGLIGGHHFYLKRYHWGALYFFTFGLLTCGYIVDLFRVPYLVRKYNRELKCNNNKYGGVAGHGKDLSDAYLLWLPFGLLGFHHYYLGNYKLGVLYTLTFGIYGLGWLIDGFRMSLLVKEANCRQLYESMSNPKPMKSIWLCYVHSLPPFGWFGLHHFYMNRTEYGYAYVVSLGQFGFGWFVDLFRMPILLRRHNDELSGIRKRDVKTVDDCYVMWFPMGLFGFHHYYLGRFGWGVLYTLTAGLFSIGWLIDVFRIPFLVKDANTRRDEMEEEQLTAESPQSQSESYHSSTMTGYSGYGSTYHPTAPQARPEGFGNEIDDNIMRYPGVPNNVPINSSAPSPYPPPAYSLRTDETGSDMGVSENEKVKPPYDHLMSKV